MKCFVIIVFPRKNLIYYETTFVIFGRQQRQVLPTDNIVSFDKLSQKFSKPAANHQFKKYNMMKTEEKI